MKDTKTKQTHSSRRDFIKTTTAATLGFNIIGCDKKARKHNLLFLWTDQQRYDTMSVYGNNKIHVPNMNKLASESVVFQKAYVSQPVCSPSRSTVMTGLWPHQNSVETNNVPLPIATPCVPEIVNDPEYSTGYFGKWHLGDEIYSQHGFNEFVSIEDNYIRFYRPGLDRNDRCSYYHYLKNLGYETDPRETFFSRDYVAKNIPLEHSKPKFLEQETCDFLRRHQNEPFMLYVNFLEPHFPLFGPLNDKYNLDYVDLPQNFNDPLEDNEPLRYRLLRELWQTKGWRNSRHLGLIPVNTEADWRRLISHYWGLVTQVDIAVGGILNTLEKLGLAENTIVVYSSDHGELLGSHKLINKEMMYEESARVPWLIRMPSERRQQIVTQPVSHIDMVPTILDLMNVTPTVQFPGQSLVTLLDGGTVKEDHVYIEWNAERDRPAGHAGTPHSIPSVSEEDVRRVHDNNTRTVVSPDGWKLCLNDRDKNQLFNLNKDPYEKTNLFYSGQYKDVIKKLADKIRGWQEKVRDSVKVDI